MNSSELMQLLNYSEIILCVVALCFLFVRRQWRQYWALGMFLLVRAAYDLLISVALLLLSKGMVEKHLVFQIYFYAYWAAFAIEAVLALFILYGALGLVLRPLRGLQRLGSRIFCGIAIFCAAMAAIVPFAPGINGFRYLAATITQLQRLQDFLTLCLVLFVLSVARAMGLSYRSTVLVVTVGLGILAAMDLVRTTGWLTHHPEEYLQYNVASAIAATVVLGFWAVHLALPERGRRTVDLPDDSLLARLDRIGLSWTGEA
jgi:hypothetical protein